MHYFSAKKIVVDTKHKEVTIQILFKKTRRFRDITDIYVYTGKTDPKGPLLHYIAFTFIDKKDSKFSASGPEEAQSLVALLRQAVLGTEINAKVEE